MNRTRWDGGIASPGKRRRRLLLLLIALLVFGGWLAYQRFFAGPSPLPVPSSTAITMPSGADVWPVAHGDVGARRVTVAAARLSAPIAWSTDLGADVATAVVADASALYVVLEDGTLLAVSVEDGRTLWRLELAFPLRAAPTVAGDRLFVSTRGGPEPIIAVDASSGEVLWSVETGSTFATSPMVVDGIVYGFFNTRAGESAGHAELVGLAAEDGELLWRLAADTLWPIVPPVFEGESLALAAGRRLLIIDRITGGERFWYTWGPRRPVYVAAADGVVYGLTPRTLVAIDIDSRRPWWEGLRGAWTWMHAYGMAPSVPAPPRDWSARPPTNPFPAVVAPHAVIVAGARGDVRAYSREGGDELWRASLGTLVGPPVLTADGLLLAQDRALVLLDASDGRELDRREFPSGGLREAVVTSHGTYVVLVNGSLIALR